MEEKTVFSGNANVSETDGLIKKREKKNLKVNNPPKGKFRSKSHQALAAGTIGQRSSKRITSQNAKKTSVPTIVPSATDTTESRHTNTEYHITMGHPYSADGNQGESVTANMNICETYSSAVEKNIASSSIDTHSKRSSVFESCNVSKENTEPASSVTNTNVASDIEEAEVTEGVVNIDVYYDSMKCTEVVSKPNNNCEETAANNSKEILDKIPVNEKFSEKFLNNTMEVNSNIETNDKLDGNPCTSNAIDKPPIPTINTSESEDLNADSVACTPGYAEDSTSQTTIISNSGIPTDIELETTCDGSNSRSTQFTKNKKHQKSINESTTTTSHIKDKDAVLEEACSEVIRQNIKLDAMAPEISKRRKVDIYTEDTGPKWYNVGGNVITRPLLPKKLPDVFDYLPIFGRPNSKAGLEEFQKNKIREFIGCDLTDEEFETLAKYCSSQHLVTGKELVMSTSIPMPGLGHDMQVISTMSSTDTERETGSYEPCIVKKCRMRMDRDPNNQFITKLKYRGMRMTPLALEEDISLDDTEELLEPGKDILFRVRIYRPFLYHQRDRPNSRRHSVFSRDVVLAGRQSLSALRDRFLCPNDLDLRVDVSQRPDDPPAACAKELFPSGFLFINNVFYVDERAGCRDTSAGVRAWAAARGLGRFPRARMCHTRLGDLALRLGHPEVYVHQGNCEHLFTFSEVRLVNPTDALRLSSYPCHTAISQNHTVYCTTCAEFGARWVVTGCKRVPFDPAFFCDTCLKLYMYKNGKKIGDFKAYSYMGNELNIHKGL